MHNSDRGDAVTDDIMVYSKDNLMWPCSHKGQFCEIEMYASSESWINIFALMYGLLW